MAVFKPVFSLSFISYLLAFCFDLYCSAICAWALLFICKAWSPRNTCSNSTELSLVLSIHVERFRFCSQAKLNFEGSFRQTHPSPYARFSMRLHALSITDVFNGYFKVLADVCTLVTNVSCWLVAITAYQFFFICLKHYQ